MATKKDWSKLNDFTHSRLRNEYLFGSRDPHTQVVLEYVDGVPKPVETTWVPAVFTAFREIVDNALDEIVKHGFGDQITVAYDPASMVISVEDNGRGIPINYDAEEKDYAATVLLSELKAGRNFEDRGEARGMNGLGASVVNICSEYFQLDIHRDKKHFSQRFHEGDLKDLIKEKAVIKATKRKETGTRVEFKLSKHVFPDMTLPLDFIKSRLLEIAICYPKLKIDFNGERIHTKGSVDKTLFGDRKPVFFEVDAEGFNSRFWLVPMFFDNGAEMTHAMVNGIPCFDGGVHIDAFRNRFFAGLLEALESQSKKRKLVPNKSDMSDGLMIFNITQMNAPSFNSQNKTRMTKDEAKKHVLKAMEEADFFKKVIRTYPEWIESIYESCAKRTEKGNSISAADKKKLKKRVQDLSDACSVNRSKCILMLAEGDSAVSGIVEARDPDLHGALPLSGKTLNVFHKNAKEVLANETLCNIMNSIGLVPNERANRAALRYNQVYITCDADEDGKNIAALLINFFYKFWPELFAADKPPFISIFETPLIIASKGKTRKYWYSNNESEFRPEDHKGWEIVRAKGLAALIFEDWEILLKQPKTFPIREDADFEETLSLIFNEDRADDRKEWMGI